MIVLPSSRKFFRGPAVMSATTPHLNESALAPLASRYVSVSALPSQKTQWAGVEMAAAFPDTFPES